MDIVVIAARLIMHVPERRGFLMTYDQKDDPCDRTWRPHGGKVRRGETEVEAAVREVREETGLRVEEFEKIPLKPYVPSAARRVALFLAIVPEAEAQHGRSHGNDIFGLLQVADIVAGTYRGVPVHSAYRHRILDEVMPLIEARAVT